MDRRERGIDRSERGNEGWIGAREENEGWIGAREENEG